MLDHLSPEQQRLWNADYDQAHLDVKESEGDELTTAIRTIFESSKLDDSDKSSVLRTIDKPLYAYSNKGLYQIGNLLDSGLLDYNAVIYSGLLSDGAIKQSINDVMERKGPTKLYELLKVPMELKAEQDKKSSEAFDEHLLSRKSGLGTLHANESKSSRRESDRSYFSRKVGQNVTGNGGMLGVTHPILQASLDTLGRRKP